MRLAIPLCLSIALLAGCGAHASARVDTPAAPGTDSTHVDPKAPKGALGGRIRYPDGVAPAMRICALSSGLQRCIAIGSDLHLTVPTHQQRSHGIAHRGFGAALDAEDVDGSHSIPSGSFLPAKTAPSILPTQR